MRKSHTPPLAAAIALSIAALASGSHAAFEQRMSAETCSAPPVVGACAARPGGLIVGETKA